MMELAVKSEKASPGGGRIDKDENKKMLSTTKRKR